MYLLFFLRQHIWFNGSTFNGHEDIGEGPGDHPATHVMMMMITALNMSWKLPVAYFLLRDGFAAEQRSELLGLCIFHLNATGVIVTNIVMDNCAVNYATFRKLGCQLARNYKDLRTATDLKNNLGKYVLILFDPPHLSKLGKFFKK